MKYTIYNPDTGEISAVVASIDSAMIANNLGSATYIPGEYDSKTHYIVDGTAVAKPAVPVDLLKHYDFDYTTKSWVLNNIKTQRLVRTQRNSLLSKVDRVNPVWYNTLSDQQRSELAAYRQALLDVPQQSGFPESVAWPTQPTWF